MVIRKRVKRLDRQAPQPRFDVNERECPEGNSSAGIEAVQHSVGARFPGEIVLIIPELGRLDSFELKLAFIGHAAAALDPFVPVAFEWMAE